MTFVRCLEAQAASLSQIASSSVIGNSTAIVSMFLVQRCFYLMRHPTCLRSIAPTGPTTAYRAFRLIYQCVPG